MAFLKITYRDPEISVVEQYCNLARRGGYSLGLADARREPPVEGASAVAVRPTVTAASRTRAAARLPERRVRDESLPPEILLLGEHRSVGR
jgi:hypothetical protein